ncbi:TonB-dependent receptor [Massilia sp. Dwa41.01b]|uniref:TonB-dependent receptor family protein n=1 Tax=unclassified Massilia TaxID=2609279 RepID=UPI0015FF2AD8|nr:MULTISPECIES: TonB-dependent receptor [unclassified Massilia]QNA87494.1 TonB-dependent receptor [Massilia sp. Dwa41.01b]QNA98401.1 TonB-dependent receptor [Massilia sp. Se16.2.3]
MPSFLFRLRLLPATLAALPALGAAQPANAPLPPAQVVVVTGSRSEQASVDLPAAIDVISADRIGAAQPRVNLSEALAAVPGVVVQNRQNYAQDLQISSRGFGARSAFGVRGVRLITDGIPATMPDGQGQAATFNLDMAERIEILRGPFSALYGNHSGGVLQLFTREPGQAPELEFSASAGSDGMRKVDINAGGQAGHVGYLLDASRFQTDGYRAHSAATREQGYAKLTMPNSGDGKLTIVANALHQRDTQDPLGISWSTYVRDPRAGEIDTSDPQSPQRSFAERYDTRKSIDHQQIGLQWQQRFGANRLQVTAYGGNRQVIQYQAFSRAFQQAGSHSGGVVDFDRRFHGIDLNWRDVRPLAGGTLRTTVGFEYASSDDDRQGFENFIGNQFGLRGRLRRDEQNSLSSLDPYLQAEWTTDKWVLTAGLRRSSLKVDVSDRFLDNGNDSGHVDYSGTAPVLGILYKVTPGLNWYASAARGFETPTLNELFYSGNGGGFNFRLRPSRSTHLETGAKLMLGKDARLDLALFQVRTTDELVVDAASGGRTSYRNAGATLRRGMELSFDSQMAHGLHTRIAANLLRAVYEEGFGSIPAGNRLPGVPRANLYGELGWATADGRFKAALEALASSKVHPDDANTAVPAPGYGIVNLRLQAHQQSGQWRFKEFARLNNLFDRDYVGSVIVGDSNRRFYEPAPGRNWVVGFSAQYGFR